MRTHRDLLLSALLLLLCLSTAHAARAESITVVTENWPPYNYKAQGQVTGVMTDVVRATLERAGLSYDIQVLPWARAYHTAMNEENVLIYTIFKLDNRAKHFQWIRVNGLTTEMYLFTPRNRSDIQLTSLEQARNYRIGVTRETSTHHFLNAHGFVEGGNLFPVSSERQNILQVEDSVRRIDLTTGDRLSLAHWLKEYGYPSDFLKEQLLLFCEDFYMAFSKKTDPGLVARVKTALRAIGTDGTLEAILESYYHTYGLEHIHPMASSESD